MSAATIQEMVAEKIKTLYRVSHELEELFPGRHYTPDGHMIGSIGEVLAAYCYGLTLFEASKETHDAKRRMVGWLKSKRRKLTGLHSRVSRTGCWCCRSIRMEPFLRYTMGRANLPGHIAGKCRRTASGPSPWRSCEACRPRSRKRTG